MTDPFDDGEIATASISNDLLKSHVIGERKFEEFVSVKVKADNPDIFTTVRGTNLNNFSKKKTTSKTSTKQRK